MPIVLQLSPQTHLKEAEGRELQVGRLLRLGWKEQERASCAQGGIGATHPLRYQFTS